MNIPALTSALIVAGLGLIVIIDGLVPSTHRPGATVSLAQRWARFTHRPAGAAGRRHGSAVRPSVLGGPRHVRDPRLAGRAA